MGLWFRGKAVFYLEYRWEIRDVSDLFCIHVTCFRYSVMILGFCERGVKFFLLVFMYVYVFRVVCPDWVWRTHYFRPIALLQAPYLEPEMRKMKCKDYSQGQYSKHYFGLLDSQRLAQEYSRALFR